jgi:hypothetical protein
MTKTPKERALLGSLVVVLALMVLTVVPAMAQVGVVFSGFTGDVTIDGADAPVGSQLRAYVDGVPAKLLPSLIVDNDICTLATAGSYEIVIQTDDTGKAVTFEVKKAGTTVWLPVTSDPASPVTSSSPQTVDLAAGTAGTFTLTIDVSPSAGGSTYPPAGEHTYAAGTKVTITATANPGWDFDHWGGAVSGSKPETEVTMNANKSVTAYFEEEGAPAATFKSWLYETFVECLVD